MRLSKIALLAVKGARPGIIPKLSKALKVEDPTTYAYIASNNENLTKAGVLQVIREVTGLTDDQILEESETESVQN
jgi:hypothetical protein